MQEVVNNATKYIHIIKRAVMTWIYVAVLFALLFISPTAPIAHADTFPILGVLHSGRAPEALAVDTQTHMLYIAHESPGLLVAFDAVRGMVRWRTALGGVATDVQVDSANHYVYVAVAFFSSRRSMLYVLNGATGGILFTSQTGFGENGIAFDTKRRRVYASDGDDVHVLTFPVHWPDNKAQVQSSRWLIGSHPQGLGVNSRSGRLYVADADEHKLRVVDEGNARVLATLAVGDRPLHPLRVDETTGRVYVVCSTGQELDVIDGNKNQVIARTPVTPYPEGVAFNTATRRIYVADEGDREDSSSSPTGTTITVIDGQSLDVLGTLSVGQAPDGVEADPGLHRVYVALEDSNAVVELSDSPNLPLSLDATTYQALAARWTIFALQLATILTLLAMLLTVAIATLSVRLRRWHERESPQTQPGGASSRSERHSLRL